MHGTFQYPGSSQQCDACLHADRFPYIEIRHSSTTEILWQGSDYQRGEELPGLPFTLDLGNGATFISQQPPDMFQQRSWGRVATWLESNRLSIFSSLLLLPFVCWFWLEHGIPQFSRAVVPFIPTDVSRALDQSALKVLDETALSPSRLEASAQQVLLQQWQPLLQLLPAHDDIRPAIVIRQSDQFGANALALPGGTIVVTDALASLLSDCNDCMTAVLLHEYGHIYHQHSLIGLTESATTAVVMAVLLNDLQGLTDLLTTGTVSLLHANYSRTMELQADQFALTYLAAVGADPHALERSLLRLQQDSHPQIPAGLLASHPELAERIEQARAHISALPVD